MTQQEQSGQALASPQPHPELEQLVAVLEQLRAPGGCVWDAEQTHESLVRYLVEETYELIDAIEGGNREEMIEELGDVLYQVIFHADIAAHTRGEDFTLEDVAAHMTAKMVGRHPHVFGDVVATPAATEQSPPAQTPTAQTPTVHTSADVNARWDEIKKLEKPTRTSVLDGVPQGMPALALADKLLGKAEKLGMPSPAGQGAAAERTESAGQRASSEPSASTAQAAFVAQNETELGDQLLAIVATARGNDLDAERALRGALRQLQDRMRIAERG
jgi:XTP/dITP diphosphohydrolase